MEGVNQAFNSLTADGLEAFGVLLGDIMTGQVGSFQDFGKKLLGAIAGFMKSFGQALIATATASKAFKELLISNPVLAAAAGVGSMNPPIWNRVVLAKSLAISIPLDGSYHFFFGPAFSSPPPNSGLVIYLSAA